MRTLQHFVSSDEFRAVRTNAPRSVVLDETAIAEEHARIKRSDEEFARRPKSRRERRWPVRSRPRER
jgi:hypothetical protein